MNKNIVTAEILEQFEFGVEYGEIDPSNEYFEPEYYSESDEDADIYHGRYVKWDLSTCGYVIELPVSRVFVTDENMWYFGHAAAIYNHIEEGDAILDHPPAGAVYRVTEKDYLQSIEWDESGELEEQTGMSEPWGKEDIGELYGYLKDGNHRFIAAVTSGETKIPFYVGENWKKNVEKDDWL
jgi:hypothetical protein